jgi:hypothetical protein
LKHWGGSSITVLLDSTIVVVGAVVVGGAFVGGFVGIAVVVTSGDRVASGSYGGSTLARPQQVSIS